MYYDFKWMDINLNDFFTEDMSTVIGRKGRKPQVEIYRPGSGPLRKSALGREEFYGEGFPGRNERSNVSKERREYQKQGKDDPQKLLDDFDRLSICSTNSRKGERSGSTGDKNRKMKLYVGMNTTYIGTDSEYAWDGGTLTFQGNQAFYPNIPPPTMFNHPPPTLVTAQAPPHMWSHTLPQVRGRGKGRVPHHELERERIAFEEARMTRSLTPESLKEVETFQEPTPLLSEPCKLGKEKESSKNVNTYDAVRSPDNEGKSLEQTTIRGLEVSENENAASSKLKSPVQPKSPPDLTTKKPAGTGMVSTVELK